jgi:hypothetical protein
MATPKIRIKRGITAPTSTNLPSSGELAIDTTAKRFYIQADPAGTTAPLWMGAEIENSVTNWNTTTKLATQSAIDTRFMPKTGGTFTGSISGTSLVMSSTISCTSLTSTLGSLVLTETGGGGNTITIQSPSDVAANVTYTLPDVPSANGKILSSTTSGTLSWVSAANGITITEATTPSSGTKLYSLLLTDTQGSNITEIYADGSPGLLPTNGPLQYNKTTGALIVNGNIVVNGPAASVTLTPTRGNATTNLISDGDTTFTFAGTVDLSSFVIGMEFGINDSYNAPSGITVTINNGTLITAVNNTSKTITISSGILVKTTSGNTSTTLAVLSNQADSLFSVATGIIDIGPNSVGNTTGNLYNTNVPTINIGRTDASTINIGKADSTVNIGTTGGNSTLTINGSSTATLTTNAATFNLANTNATAVNIGGAAATLTLGGAASATTNINVNPSATTTNIATGANASGTKTINIGTGASGGTSTITIGTASGGSNSITINGLITNTAGNNPTANTLVTKTYVDGVAAAGLTSKTAVRVATTTSGTLSSSFENGDTIDGVTLATNDRILIKDQATATENGIYVVKASGAPDRATDANEASELTKGTYVFVTAGTSNAGKGFILRTGVVTLGTDALNWDQFTSSTLFTFSDGLTNTSGTITVNPASNGGLTVGSGGVSISSSFAGKGLSLNSGVLTVDGHTTVKVATTTSGTLSTSFRNAESIDGVTLATNDRILIKNQSNPSENGIYFVNASGSPTRATDADTSAELLSLRRIYVTSGSANTGKVFKLTNTAAITVGTTQINYVEDSATGGSSYTPEQYFVIGAGLDRTSTAAAKSYTLNGTWTQNTALAANGTFTITFGSTGNVILDSIYPGMAITKLGTTFTSNLIIDSISRNASPRTITVRNIGTAASVSITAASTNTDFIVNGDTSTGSDSYDTSNHKGILVYKNKDYSTWSVLGYNKSSDHWSIFNQGSNTEYPIVTRNGVETLTNKTLSSAGLTYTAYNSSTYINDASLPAAVSGAVQNAYMWDPFVRTTYSASGDRAPGYIWSKDHDLGYVQKWMSTDPVAYAANAQTVPSSGTNDDVITLNSPNNNELRTGHAVRAFGAGTGITNGITNGSLYYIIKVGPSSIKIASSYADAIAGIAINVSGNAIDTGSNYLRFYTYINTTKLGSDDVVGGGAYIKLANTEFFGKYDTVFGDSYALTETTTTNIGNTGDSIGSTYSYLITSINDGVSTAPDNEALNVDLGPVSSIALDGSSTATITFSTAPSVTTNGKLTANRSYVMLCAVNTGNSTVNTLMNFYHKVTAYTAGSTSVTVELRRAATGLTGNYTANVGFGVKNYEVKIIMAAGAPTYSVGDSIVFSSSASSTSDPSRVVIGDYAGTHGSTRTDSSSWTTSNASTTTARVTTVFTTANSKVFSFRCPYPLTTTSGGTLLNTVPIFGAASISANLRLSLITAQEALTSYTGRRVLLNTLIDCGSY